MKRKISVLLLTIGGLTACGGGSKQAPPPGSVDEPVPVEVAEEESTSPDSTDVSPPPSEESADTEVDADNTTEEETIAEAPPKTTVPEEPAPSGDLQAYVNASTGYTPEFRTVKDNMNKFKQCYLDAMRANPDISGTIKIRFTVQKSGKVKKAKATLNELNDDVVNCILREMKALKFPKRAKKRTVEYPFKFIPSPG